MQIFFLEVSDVFPMHQEVVKEDHEVLLKDTDKLGQRRLDVGYLQTTPALSDGDEHDECLGATASL